MEELVGVIIVVMFSVSWALFLFVVKNNAPTATVSLEIQRISEEFQEQNERLKQELIETTMANDRFDGIISQYLQMDDAWKNWMKSLGEATFSHEECEQLAHKLWVEAGQPFESGDHFWFLAEQQLTKRSLAEKGVSGACMSDREIAKKEAIAQFIRRRKAAIRDGIIENSSLHAGMPMIFYCKTCGIQLEVLPEDYLFSPRKRCSQCKGLDDMGWLDKALCAADEAGLQLPAPKRWVPNETREENSEVAQ